MRGGKIMAVGKETFCTSEVSRSSKIYHKNICLNKKSFTAMLLSAALFLTSVDCMKVQAEELKDQAPPAQTEDTQEPGSVSDNTLPEEDGTREPDYVKNADGAVIITSFGDLPEDVCHIELGEEETLEEAVSRMPATLKAYADVYVAADKPDTDESDDEPGEEESGPDAGDGEQTDDEENQPGTGEEEEGWPGENEGDNSGDDQSGEGDNGNDGEKPDGEENGDSGAEEQPDEGANGGGEGGEQPGGGEGGNGSDSEKPDGEENGGGGVEEQPDEGESEGNGGDQSGDNESGNGGEGQASDSAGGNPDEERGDTQAEPGDIAAANAYGNFASQAEERWRLLVAADENADHADNGSSHDGDEVGGDEGENRQPGDGTWK